MKARNLFPCLTLLVLVLCAAVEVTLGQDLSAAGKVYTNWKEKNAATELISGGNHVGVGFAVSRDEKTGTRIDVAVGVGNSVTELSELKFTVQPVSIKQNAEGKPAFENIGQPSVINFPKIDKIDHSEGDIVASPRIRINTPAEAGAIKITVQDQAQNRIFSVTLPLGEKVSTAILGGSVGNSGTARGKCLWYTGSCGGGCGGATMCVGCNNASPDLNCVSCEMGCVDGGECSPSTPRPFNCSE